MFIALSAQIESQQCDVGMVLWIHLQGCDYLRGTHQQHLVASLWLAEVVFEEAHHVGGLVIVAVLGDDLLFALTREGIFLAILNLIDNLGVELRVVYLPISLSISINDAVDLDHHIAAAAALVLQRNQRVCRRAEGGIALALLESRRVEFALLHIGTLDEVLEEGRLCLANLIILIDIDEQETAQGPE